MSNDFKSILYVSFTTIGSFRCYLHSHWLSKKTTTNQQSDPYTTLSDFVCGAYSYQQIIEMGLTKLFVMEFSVFNRLNR